MSATVDGQALHYLVAEAQRGNRPAVDRLVQEHDSWLRSVIYGVTGRVDLVDDIAQQVWMQVWQRLDSLKDPERLRPWLAKIARHAAIDAGMARRRHDRRTGSLESVSEPGDETGTRSPVGWALGNELRTVLLQAVSALPALYREPFVLRHLESWSYAEIGEVLGLPVETVETRLVRARRLLREMLNDKVHE
ncbi:MAG: RNA polymerase sigma factor [Phycisphaerae bacterium]|jgi:RNA polymerase sigma-70 factor (ECF subfamily)